MKKMYLTIFLIIFLNQQLVIHSEELLELNCLNGTECTQFTYAGIKSDCIEEHCQCTTSTGERVKCKPMNYKVNNIIGGPCPCELPNAECDTKQDVCYCAKTFMPSIDKRRCIKKIAMLDEKCELDLQCQRGDFNAICHVDTKKCYCMEHFVNETGKCASIVGDKSFCTTNAQCIEKFDINTKCNNATQYCICIDGYFASVDNSLCLKVSNYLGNCTEHLQCQGAMGTGGKCMDNICQCSEKYYVEERKTATGKSETICTPVVQRGQYCRYAEDCYERHLNESEQSMDCIYGECNCKIGFNSFNEGECFKGGSGMKSMLNFVIIICIITIVNRFYIVY